MKAMIAPAVQGTMAGRQTAAPAVAGIVYAGAWLPAC